jgi:hypothetical protein
MEVLGSPGSAEWGRLLLGGLMHHMLAAAAWLGAKAAIVVLQAVVAHMLGVWTSSRATTPKAQHTALIAAQVLPPLVLGVVLTLLLVAEHSIAARVDPFLVLGAIKQAVVDMLHRMELLGALQKVRQG